MKPHPLFLSWLTATPLLASAFRDYGVRGNTFPIEEKSLFQVIQNRLAALESSGRLQQAEEKWQEQARAQIHRPTPVSGIATAKTARSWLHDPSYTQPIDIKDHQGEVIVPEGTRVNPLEHVPWGEPLLFIDGDDKAQIAWATAQEGKILLVKGSPLELFKTHDCWFYFDQAGSLTSRFHITQVPARVTQRGLQLKIEEVAL